MSTYSFIDTIFKQFTPINWQNGISIFRSGGILNFETYGELASVRIRTGIGENFDVRIKLHTSGRFVQWMECTCQANRRRGEKCSHIAAFCIYLSHDHAQYLKNLKIDAGDIEPYLNYSITQERPLEEKANSKNFDFKEKLNLIQESKSLLKDNSIENIFSQSSTEIISVNFDEDIPWVNVEVRLEGNRKINYRFGVDDTCRLFFNSTYAKNVSKKLQASMNNDYYAKRIFEVKKSEMHGLLLARSIAFVPKKINKEFKEIVVQVESIQTNLIGRFGTYDSKFGFMMFEDNLNPVQISRWGEYPKRAILEGDQAAALIENEYSFLKEVAEVRLQDDVLNSKIFEKITIPEFSLKQSIEGHLVIQAKVTAENGESNDDQSQNTILEILKARAEGRKYIQTEKGFIKVTKEFDWLQKNVQENGEITLSTIEFIRFHEQFGKESQINDSNEFINKLRQGLISRENLSLPDLENTNLNLRNYQQEGLKWLWWLYSNSLGGLLADEMGLGKTHQAMALIAAVASKQENSIFLVVCPTTVIDHWLDKLQTFVPNLECISYHGTQRKNNLKNLSKCTKPVVLITSYGILLRDVEFLMQFKWNINILDEAHLVKNQSSRTYRAACRLKSHMRLCLTGTPLENDLFELKNLFDYIVPNYLGSNAEFKKKYMNTLDYNHDPVSDMELYRLIHPFKMRRNKLEVLTDLPEKVEDIRYCHLNATQKKLYQETLNLKGKQIILDLQDEKNPVPFIHIFSLISLLKQICDDPYLIDPKYETSGSGKLNLFDELLAEALESDHKVVVFSQYAKMIQRLSKRLTLQKINHVTLTGQTQQRGKVVKKFQEDPTVKVFLGSLLAGGTGIDLTSANIVIHFDRWWNAAKEDQATDRIHRIGQVKNVQVYKLITKGTLEERIDEIISRKKLIFERFVEQDEDVFKHLTRADLLQLLHEPVQS